MGKVYKKRYNDQPYGTKHYEERLMEAEANLIIARQAYTKNPCEETVREQSICQQKVEYLQNFLKPDSDKELYKITRTHTVPVLVKS